MAQAITAYLLYAQRLGFEEVERFGNGEVTHGVEDPLGHRWMFAQAV